MEFLTPKAQMMEPSAVFPRFYMRQKQNEAKTREEGRPIFFEKEYVEIIIGGDKKTRIDTPVNDDHRKRWPEHYRRFKEGGASVVEGTSLKEWGAIPATRALELNAMNVFTVEQLSDLSDTMMQNIGMDGRALVAKAKAFIEARKDAGAIEKYAAENTKLRDDVDFLKLQLEELQQQVKASKPKTSTAK